ncbi:MAG: cyclic nucleotide-binding protein [Anaerolinea sp.]|nr:cyclic nucleotide-binding protein [Anaerolinea sp.]
MTALVDRPATAANVILLDDDRWDRVLAATHGEAAACYQCGTCTATCPWGLVAGPSIGVRSVIREAQLGIDGWAEAVWRCTTCGACEARCPHQVPIGEVMLGLRGLAWRERTAPGELSSVLWDMHWDGNPWGRPPSTRSAWAAGLDIPRFDPGIHTTLLYIGCTASYDRRAQKVARAVVGLMRAGGVPFGTLGDDEPCCGDPARSLGNDAYFERIAAANAAQFKVAGVTDIVTVSPHCYDTFSSHYGAAGDQFQVRHYSQLARDLIAEGKLTFSGLEATSATFHDPCYLARHHDETEAPRAMLAAIPGLELAEMERSRSETLCCGGGGGRMWMETPADERFATARAREAAATGAAYLVTTCPHCISCLEDGVSVAGARDLKVIDLAELAMLAGCVSAPTTSPEASHD